MRGAARVVPRACRPEPLVGPAALGLPTPCDVGAVLGEPVYARRFGGRRRRRDAIGADLDRRRVAIVAVLGAAVGALVAALGDVLGALVAAIGARSRERCAVIGAVLGAVLGAVVAALWGVTHNVAIVVTIGVREVLGGSSCSWKPCAP